MYVAIDRTCKFAYAQLYSTKTSQTAIQFLKELIDIVPYKIHTILTDNGRQSVLWGQSFLFSKAKVIRTSLHSCSHRAGSQSNSLIFRCKQNCVNRILKQVRIRTAEFREQESYFEKEKIEIDESYFELNESLEKKEEKLLAISRFSKASFEAKKAVCPKIIWKAEKISYIY